MRVPLPWLREYCDPELDVAGIEERLTMTGTKVEAIHHHGVSSTDETIINGRRRRIVGDGLHLPGEQPRGDPRPCDAGWSSGR